MPSFAHATQISIRWHHVSLGLNLRVLFFKVYYEYTCIYMLMLHVHSGSAEAWALHMPGKYHTSELHSQLRDSSDSLTTSALCQALS